MCDNVKYKFVVECRNIVTLLYIILNDGTVGISLFDLSLRQSVCGMIECVNITFSLILKQKIKQDYVRK